MIFETEESFWAFVMVVVFIIIWNLGLIREFFFRLSWIKTEGTFIRLTSNESFSPKAKGYGGVAPIIEYKTTSGIIRSNNNFFAPETFYPYKVGQKLTIYYNPKEIKRFRIKGDKFPLLFFLLFLFIGIVMGLAFSQKMVG